MTRPNSRRALLGLALPIVLAPAAAGAADLADRAGAPAVAADEIAWTEIEISAGGRYFDPPDRSLGRLEVGGARVDLTGELDGWGSAAEFSLRRAVPAARWPLFLEATGFVAGASLHDTLIVRPGGTGTFGATGFTTGGAFAGLSAAAAPGGASATAAIRGVSSSGDTGSIDTTVGTATGFSANASTTFINGGVLNALVLADGRATPSATAIGAAFVDRGLAIAATGDLSRVQIVNRYDSDILYLGGELRAGLDRRSVGAATVSPFAGLSIRAYEEEAASSTGLGFLPPPATGGAPSLPAQTATIVFDERVTGAYYGASLGADVELPLTERVSAEFGVVGSAFYLDADYRGRQTGVLATGLAAGTVSVAAPTLTQDEDRAAVALGVELGVGYRLGSGKLSLTGSVEYLSDVPTVASQGGLAALTAGPGGTAAGAGSLAGAGREGRLVFDSMTSYGLRVGYSARF